jgi:hypothetical protein
MPVAVSVLPGISSSKFWKLALKLVTSVANGINEE